MHTMFDGIPHITQDAPDLYLFTLTLITAGLIMWIRQGFLKEWRLRDYLKNNMNRIWQRGADEVPQAEGIAVNHLIGVLSFGIMTWSSFGCITGMSAGVGFIVLRQLMFRIAGAFPKTAQLANEHDIIDRLTRLWMAGTICMLGVVNALIPGPYLINPIYIFGGIWICAWLFRMFRVYQSAQRRLNSIPFSFMYLCALEIFPVLAFVKLMSVSTKWI